ncbi:spore coat U domain-containing protein [Sphingopyxis sp.]|uniref:Csu type fimbrial protein n=1 Tax=Sphingopyxis sp. TaxID=1908224 RepID=UPI003BACCCED
MRKTIQSSLAGLGLAAASLATPAQADITGTIDATITLEAGCIINGQTLSDGAGGADFGAINFGTQNTLFAQSDAEVLNSGSALSIQCSPGITPNLSFEAGENDGDGAGVGLRAMAHASAVGQFVTYNLYTDAGRTAILPIGGDIGLAATGAVQTVRIYGRAFGEAGLLPGSYSDTITVVVEL